VPVCNMQNFASRGSRPQVWEQTGQLRSESNGAALTESEVAAELASVPDEELLVAMQVRLPSRLCKVPSQLRVAAETGQLTFEISACSRAGKHGGPSISGAR